MASRGNPGPLQFFNVLAYQPMTEKTVSYFHSELGYFSIDQDRFFLSNKSKLGTLRLPRDCKHLDIDLNAGFEEWKNLPNVQQHLDSMLYWILFNKESMTAAADFRGVRSDLGYCAYNNIATSILRKLATAWKRGGGGHAPV